MKFNGKAVMASVLALGITTVASVADASISASKRPLQTYTSQRVYCGNNPGATSSSYWIDANVDLVKITEYSGTWAKGTYPNSKGVPVSRWFNMANVLGNINYSNWTGKANRAMSVYRMNSGSTTIGSVPNGEPLEVVSESNGRYQVIYVLANGAGYKMGWVPTSYVSKPAPAPNPSIDLSKTNNVSQYGYAYPMGTKTSFVDNTKLGYPHDYIIKAGTPVYAISDGTTYFYQVIGDYGGRSNVTVSYGNVAYHKCSNSSAGAIYAHMNDFNGIALKYASSNSNGSTYTKVSNRKYVYLGSRNVKRGDLIGHVGNVGNSSTAHLHFEFLDYITLAGMGTSNPSMKGKRLNINFYFSGQSGLNPYI